MVCHSRWGGDSAEAGRRPLRVVRRRRGAAAWLRAAACVAVLATNVSADSPREAIEKGNALYAAGRYAEALDEYNRIADPPLDSLAAEWLSNRAAAHFKLGQYEQARDLWVRAAAMRDAAFEARCRYNLGTIGYREVLDAIGHPPAAAGAPVSRPGASGLPAAPIPDAPASVPLNAVLERIDAAMSHFRDALQLDPSLVDARANLELANQLRQQLLEHATSQPQSQPSPESQNEQRPDENRQESSSSQPSSQPDQGEPSSESQPATQPESQPQSQPSDAAEPQPESQPASESQPAPEPADEPESTSQPQPPPGEDEPPAGRPSELAPEQVQRMLQQVRDAERLRRQALKAREAAKHKPVEKDW